jgi:hypothetical protein
MVLKLFFVTFIIPFVAIIYLIVNYSKKPLKDAIDTLNGKYKENKCYIQFLRMGAVVLYYKFYDHSNVFDDPILLKNLIC